MNRLVFVVFTVLFLSQPVYAKFWNAHELTGGCTDCLDNRYSYSGQTIEVGDVAIVQSDAYGFLVYELQDVGGEESAPTLIDPDNANAGADWRWVLIDQQASGYYVDGSQISSDDLSDTDSLAMLDEAETISGNWVNTTNPWADNEVSDTLTVGFGGSVNAGALPSSGTWNASGLDLTLPNTAYDPTPSSDDSWQGAIMTVTGGESIDQWDIIYLKYDTDGPRAFSYHADSTDDDNDTYTPFGIAIEDGSAGSTMDIGIGFGVARNDGWPFTDETDEGKPVYCSEAAAGGIELEAPADSGDHVIRIGTLIDEDEVLFNFGFADVVVP